MPITIKPSTNAKKKYMVVIDYPNIKRTIHFGAAGMSDYTKHKDAQRKQRYDARHKANENWNDPLTAGFWAKWVLWNKESLDASKRDAIKKASSIIRKQ